MRNQLICLASLVILTGAVGTASARMAPPRFRTTLTRRLPLREQNPGRAAATIEIFASSYRPEPVGAPGPKQLAVKAKRELLKVAISFERYRIAQRKFPLKLHDQFEVLAVRHADGSWTRWGAYSKLETSDVVERV